MSIRFLCLLTLVLALGQSSALQASQPEEDQRDFASEACEANMRGLMTFPRRLAQALATFAMAQDQVRDDHGKDFWYNYNNNWIFAEFAKREPIKSRTDALRRYYKVVESFYEQNVDKGRIVHESLIYDLDLAAITTIDGSQIKPFHTLAQEVRFNPDWIMPKNEVINRFEKPEEFRQSHEAYAKLLSPYEIAMLFIRPYDYIKADGKLIKLGIFLGAGNAKHVYELADDPKLAVQIPYLAPNPMVLRAYNEKLTLKEYARKMLLDHRDQNQIIRKQSKKIRLVEFYEVGSRGQYAIVDRIHGNNDGTMTDGMSFLNELIQEEKMLRAGQRKVMFQKLNLALKELKFRPVALPELMFPSNYLIDLKRRARQLIWEEDFSDWVLVDSEPGTIPHFVDTKGRPRINVRRPTRAQLGPTEIEKENAHLDLRPKPKPPQGPAIEPWNK